jgi:hypothetical protein
MFAGLRGSYPTWSAAGCNGGFTDGKRGTGSRQANKPGGIRTYSKDSGEIETVEVHHLDPGRDKVADEFLLPIFACIDFAQGPQLSMRTEDQIDPAAGPLHFAGLAVAPFEHVIGGRDRFPFRTHVEQVAEEVVGQRFRPAGEDTMLAILSGMDVQGTQAADKRRY